MSRERPRCQYVDEGGRVCGLLKAAAPHVGYGEGTHDYKPPAREGFGAHPRPLRARSAKTEDYYREERRPAVAAAVGKPCEVKSPVCTGKAQGLHEPATRGRFGGLRAAVEEGGTVPACHSCNNWLSQTVEGQRWGRERGLLKSNRGETARRSQPPRRPRSMFK